MIVRQVLCISIIFARKPIFLSVSRFAFIVTDGFYYLLNFNLPRN